MRVAYVANIRLPTEKAHGIQIMKTCEALALLGHDVELIVPNRKTHITDDPFSYYGVKKHFPIRRLPVWDTAMYGRFGFLLQSLTFACTLRYHLREKTYDVLYSRDEHILAFLKAPFVWESHTGAWNRAAQRVARRAKHIVTISNGLKEFYATKGIRASCITVAHDGIDPAQFANPESKEAARARLGLLTDTQIAMYIGRLDGWKGTDTLLQAAKLLPSNVMVVIIGGEPEQVSALSSQYPNVRFLGFHPYKKLADNMVAADVLILPNTGTDKVSTTFTSPLKLFAYMTSGVPIVASDLPSIREVLDEHSAILVPPDDVAALATGIQRALQEAGTRATAASERVKKYSWKCRAERIVVALSVQNSFQCKQ